MGFMDWINEQIYILFSMYYYEVFVYMGKTQVGRFIQTVRFNSHFLVDINRKKAWIIDREGIYQKGHKLIAHVDLNKAVSLQEFTEEKIEEISANIQKIKKSTKLIGEISDKEKRISKNKKFTESNMNPDLVFEIFNAHFVKKVMADKKGTDWSLVIIAILVAIVIIVFMVIMVFGLK